MHGIIPSVAIKKLSEVIKMAKKRYMQVNVLKSEAVEAYKEAHVNMHTGPWKEQLDVLVKAGAEECIVYLYENLSILLYVCDDIEESFNKLGQDERRKAWDDFTGPMFANTVKFDGSSEIKVVEKIYDMKEQLEGKLTQF